MVWEIVRDVIFLGQKSETATKEDMAIANGLLDTLKAHAHHCVGMAANMIGEAKCIIAIKSGEAYLVSKIPQEPQFSWS